MKMIFSLCCKMDRISQLRCTVQAVGVAVWLLGICAVSMPCPGHEQDALAAPGAGVQEPLPVMPEVAGEPEAAVNPEEPKQPTPLALMRKEMAAQLRPALYAEIYFVHLVCDTNARERRKLLAAAEAELEKVVTSAALQALAPDNARPQAGRIVRDRQNNQIAIIQGGLIQGDRAVISETEPAEVLAEVLMRLVTEQLGEERGARFRQEMKQRVEAQRRATIGHLIALLDAFLLLSPEQQEELAQRLLPAWREEWRRIPFAAHDQYLPDMVLLSEALTVLSPEQKKRYWAIPKVRFANQQHQQLPGVNLEQDADRWKKILENLDRAEQQGETRR